MSVRWVQKTSGSCSNSGIKNTVGNDTKRQPRRYSPPSQAPLSTPPRLGNLSSFSTLLELPKIFFRNVVAYIQAGRDWLLFQKCETTVCIPPRLRFSCIRMCRMGWGPVLSQLSGGPKFRKHRKIIQETMGTRAINEYASLQKKTTYTFLADLGDTPANFADHINRWGFRRHDAFSSSHPTLCLGFVRSFYRGHTTRC